jgi:ubiquinone/menaquinone biosynthesis C-methylase UbiE
MRRAGVGPYVQNMTSTESFQIPPEAAEAYEAKFVPAIFAEWAPHTVDAAGVGPGDRVLDVACGTGVVARTAAGVVGPDGRVTGVDLNQAMLTVAARVAPGIEWHQGDVAALPFPDASFDASMCQMALMFFPDRTRAIEEMARVTRPGGRVAIVVPAGLSQQPAYRQFVDIAARHAGDEARPLLSTYWNCGDLDALAAMMEDVGLVSNEARTKSGPARFDSPEDLVVTEVEGSPLAEQISDDAYAAIRRDVGAEMARYVTADGRFEIPIVCHVVSGRVA